MATRTIQLKHRYQDNIKSLDEESAKVRNVVCTIYDRFINEQNANHKEYAINALQEYRYIPSKCIIPTGVYLRYIDTKNVSDMKLKVGGFVLNDNGYSVTFKSSANNMPIKLNKRKCILFTMITYNDRLRCAIADK